MILLNIIALPILVAIAALHLLWAARIWWPIADESELVRAVAGFPKTDRMPPPVACLVVALAVLIAAIPPVLALSGPQLSGLARLVALGAGTVFLARGLIGVTPFWARMTPEQPFRRLDRRYYSPLITALGVVFLLNCA